MHPSDMVFDKAQCRFYPTILFMLLLHRNVWHPITLLLMLAVWLATIGNLPLWLAVARLPEITPVQASKTLAFLIPALISFSTAFLALTLWPRWLKGAGLLLLTVAASSCYFMLTYGVVIDPSMVANVIHTDVREARDLLSWPLAVSLLLGVVLPGVWWWRQNLQPTKPWRLLLQQGALGIVSLLVCVAMLWLAFDDLASLMRNHKSLRYMINPFNTVYGLIDLSMGKAVQAQEPMKQVGQDAHLLSSPKGLELSPMIVLVVGETARAANFGLGGYIRDTTPRLQALAAQGQLTYFSQVTSCGTNTQTSLPCMFSPLGRNGFLSQTGPSEGLLDVLQRAGLAVLWLDNQSGCKGVCDRIPNVNLRAQKVPGLCNDDDCFDEILLQQLPLHLEMLPPEQRVQGTVVVLHPMGSHGPAYYKRSPAAHKHFQPECTSHSLANCSPEHLINAYDNSLRYTDYVLAETIDWLSRQSRPTALLYVSDHGESLGEKGLYLHGMPYRLAPSEQTHVPMVLWLSPAMQRERGWSMECIQGQSHKPFSHDHFFHTVLQLAQVRTQAANTSLDILAPCTPPTASSHLSFPPDHTHAQLPAAQH